MVRVDKVFDFFFDGFGLLRDIIFGKELFFFVIVDFIVANGAYFGDFVGFGSQQASVVFFLVSGWGTYFLSLF